MILKCLLGPSNEHRLNKLGDPLVRVVEDTHGQSVPTWITHGLNELTRIDPTSQAFRYGEDRYTGAKSSREAVPDETYVRVSELRLEMTRLYQALDDAVDVAGGNKGRLGP